jgi:hypothetical protein
MNYPTTLQGWHDFYMITGTAAASLVGLLFVGLSLHLRVVVTHGDVRALARITLASLGLTLVLSLFMVLPPPDSPSSTGWNVVGVGVFGLVLIAAPLVAGIRSSHRALSVPHVILRFGLTTLTFGGVITAGVILVAGDYHTGLTWLVAVSIVLLVGALRNSWDLLVSVGAATMHEAEAPKPIEVTAAKKEAPPHSRHS